MRPDRFLTAILVIIAALVIASLGLFALRQRGAEYRTGAEPADVVYNYVLALQQGDDDRAFAALASFEGRPERAAFTESLRQQYGEIAATAVDVGAVRVGSNTAEVDLTLVHAGGGLFSDPYREQQIALLTREDGAWKINQMPYPYWSWAWTPELNTKPALPVLPTEPAAPPVED